MFFSRRHQTKVIRIGSNYVWGQLRNVFTTQGIATSYWVNPSREVQILARQSILHMSLLSDNLELEYTKKNTIQDI